MNYKKHKNLTLKGITIEQLEKDFNWFCQAETKDAIVTVEYGKLFWKNGIWRDGTWQGGIWKDGKWWGGDWYGGIWKGGVWVAGNWLDGDWKGGYVWSKKAPNE